MKPNVIKRVAAAAAFAGIAALVSACGSSNGAASGLPGGIGPSITNGAGCTGLSQAVEFSGVAAMDNYGNVYAGQEVGPLTLSAATAVQGGGYEFGRINTSDGSTLEFNLSGVGAYGGVSGGQMSIQGMYIMGQDVYEVLATLGSSMGYGSTYPTTGYSGYGEGCGISSFMIEEMGTEAMSEAESTIGAQPFTYALVSGELILNGEINAPY